MGIYWPESFHLFAHGNVLFLQIISVLIFWSIFGGKQSEDGPTSSIPVTLGVTKHSDDVMPRPERDGSQLSQVSLV